MDLASLRERLKSGVTNLNSQESYTMGEVLLMSASETNAQLAFSLLEKTTTETVPCIDYFRAEAYFHKAKFKEARSAIDQFLASSGRRCESNAQLFKCCPDSKYRNANGLKKLIEANISSPPAGQIQVSVALHKVIAKEKKSPLVVWKNMLFLLDTGAEHNVWNSQCEKELKFKKDLSSTYSGSDSLGQLIVTHYVEPQAPVFGLKPTSLAGFMMDLSFTAKDYLSAKEKFCGILSPQRLIPTGVMLFDWAGDKILLCQGEKCRASLDLPSNCPMPMFKGRPYFSMSIQGEKERLFLVDTGANSTSSNANYFSTLPPLAVVNSTVSSATVTLSSQKVMKNASLELCGVKLQASVFSVRDHDEGWEWQENGKIGMDIMYSSVLALDFGKSMCLFK